MVKMSINCQFLDTRKNKVYTVACCFFHTYFVSIDNTISSENVFYERLRNKKEALEKFNDICEHIEDYIKE